MFHFLLCLVSLLFSPSESMGAIARMGAKLGGKMGKIGGKLGGKMGKMGKKKLSGKSSGIGKKFGGKPSEIDFANIGRTPVNDPFASIRGAGNKDEDEENEVENEVETRIQPSYSGPSVRSSLKKELKVYTDPLKKGMLSLLVSPMPEWGREFRKFSENYLRKNSDQ
jgi:hypothetical protein